MELLWRSERKLEQQEKEKHYSENGSQCSPRAPWMYVLEKLNWVPWDLDGFISPSLTTWEKIQMLMLLSHL